MPTPRWGASATKSGNYIYVFAGATNFFFDLWNDGNSLVVDHELAESFTKIERGFHRREPEMAAILKVAEEDAPEYGHKREQARRVRPTVLEMCRQVMAVGERVHYLEVTERIKKMFPEWEHGLTPDASVRRDLNYNSDRHASGDAAVFGVGDPEGFYVRIR